MAPTETLGSFIRSAGLGSAGENLARALDQLAGKEIGSGGSVFFRNLKDARAMIEPWVPIHMLPIGYEAGAPIGLHIRPAGVQAGRFGVLLGVGGTALAEVATSLDAYVFRAAAHVEAEVNDGDADDEDLQAAVTTTSAAYGPDFYKPGWMKGFGVDDLEDIMVERFGGSPYDFSILSNPEPAPDGKLAILRKGLSSDPGSLHLHAQCARLLADKKDWDAAAREAIDSLGCYFHTAAVTDTADHLAFCRGLIKKVAAAQSGKLQDSLPPETPQERLQQVGTLIDERRLADAEKALADLCYDLADYVSTVEVFDNVYRKLEWSWGRALCGLRSS
jgi:hypothetical protein